MVTHEMNVYERFYAALADMSKPFEIRRETRHYTVGDTCIFHERIEDDNSDELKWTGRTCVRRITYVLSHDMFYAVPKGWVILGLKEVL